MEQTEKKKSTRPSTKKVTSRPATKSSTETTRSTSTATHARGFIQSIGRRKRAVARLRLTPNGDGTFIVNGKKYTDYFPYTLWREVVISPLPLVGLQDAVNISVKVQGGGVNAQSEAIRLALARALVTLNNDWRPTLRKVGWLTRDAREKERKKPGLKRARRAPQWQKR